MIALFNYQKNRKVFFFFFKRVGGTLFQKKAVASHFHNSELSLTQGRLYHFTVVD